MTLWILLPITSLVIFITGYMFYDLTAYEDEFDRSWKSTAKHLGVLIVAALLWPLTWLIIALLLISGNWDTFINWYRIEIAPELNGI